MDSAFITNQKEFLSKVIGDILPVSDKLYFLVGYFYFSGFGFCISKLWPVCAGF